MKRFLIILLAALAAVSCIGDDTILCRDTVMGNIKGGVLYTDGGLIYNIVKTNVPVDVADTVRVLVVCDVIKQTGDSEKEYDICLLDYTTPVCKDALTASKVTDWDEVGSDPVGLQSGWFSGGYINMNVIYSFDSSSKTVHTVNLVYDDVRSGSDTLFFELRHNAFGECFCEDTKDDENIAVTTAYASFPLEKFLPSGKDSVVVSVDWTWYENGGGYLSTDTRKNTTTGTYTISR